MIISIGILACNEASSISRTLKSLFLQSVFSIDQRKLDGIKWEIIVVPNGCTDKTADIARIAFLHCYEQLHERNEIIWKILEIEQGGKSNAWNHYIHDFSDKEAKFIIMIDADIEFDHIDTIYNTIKEIKNHPNVDVVVDTPKKHFVNKKNKTLIEKISTIKSDQTLQGDPAIAGSFYCARAKILRKIWMPIGLTGEDGFLRAMIITNLFRNAPDPTKICRAPNASHFYEGLTDLNAIFKHEIRMVIGTTYNCYFCWDFLIFATDPTGPGAGYLIKSRLDHSPNWYKEFISNEVKNRGLWVLPKNMLFRNLIRMKNITPNQFAKNLLLSIVGMLLDVPVMIIANYKIKKGSIGYW